MLIEKADAFFSAKGFWQNVAPRIAGSYVLFAGIGIYSLGQGLDASRLALILGLVFLLIVAPQVVRYRRAAKKHRDLKALHGERYVQLIEQGQIPINATTVLVMGSPGRQVLQLLPTENTAAEKIGVP